MTLTQTPAGRTIARFGGITRCARALGKPKSTVQRWKDSGFIHPDYYPAMLAAAVAEGIVLDVSDFNMVDVNHPAFNEVSSRVPGDSADHALGSSGGPNPEIVESPLPVRGSADRVVTPAPTGG